MANYWTKEELQFLNDNWRSLTDVELSKRINRSRCVIKQKRWKLGFLRLHKSVLTPEIRKYIKQNYRDLSDAQIAIKLNVKQSTIEHWRLKTMGLTKVLPRTRMSYTQRAKSELFALQSFAYSGVMKESFDLRVKFLEGVVGIG